MKGFVIGMLLLALTGCIAMTGDWLRDDLKAYKGHDIHELAAKIGFPAGEREIMGQHLYVWATDNTGLLPVTSLSSGFGNVGGASYSGFATTTSLHSVRFHCTLEIGVDAQGVITSAQFQGNNGGCRQYVRQLERK